MNKNQRGNASEAAAERCLQREGYRTHRVRRAPMRRRDGSWWSPPVDIMAGDIVAWKPGERIRVVQVTSSSNIQDRIDAFVAEKVPLEHAILELWQDRSVNAGPGITKSEWGASRHFRVRWSDDDFALVPDRIVWFDGEAPSDPIVTQRRLR